MRLNRLHLVNYRRFRDASLEFPDGIIGVVGRNGAGKSTTLEAILWCLFGHDAARTSKELLKRQEAAPGEDVAVRLEFEIDGTGFAVTRRLRGKSMQPEAAVESGDQLLVAPGANSWDQASQYLGRLLGFERGAFESTVVAKQGELAALSELRPADRKRLLLGMLGIEQIDRALQRVRQDARLLEVRVHEIRRGLDAEPRLQQELATAGQEHADLVARLAVLQQELDALRPRASTARATADRLLGARTRDQELRLRLQHLQARLESTWAQRTRLAAEQHLIRDRDQEADRIRVRLAELGGVDDDLQSSDAAARHVARQDAERTRLHQIEQEVARWAPHADPKAQNGSSPAHLEETLARLRHAVDEAQRRGARIGAELEAAALEVQHLERDAHGAAPLGPDEPCPTCGKVLGKAAARTRRRRDEDRAQQSAALRSRMAALRIEETAVQAHMGRSLEERTQAEGKLEEVRRRIQKAALAADEVHRLGLECQALQERTDAQPSATWDEATHRKLVARRDHRDALRLALARVEEQAQRLPRLRDEDRILQGQEEAVVAERETHSREIRQIAYEAGSWERVQAECEASRDRLERLERERAQWSERAMGRGRDVERLRTALSEIAARRDEAEAGAKELRLLDALGGRRADQGLLAEFRNHLVGRIRPALARHASSLLCHMTSGRYTELVLDEDYSPRLVDQGIAHPLERFSGGEVDLANLALRLAVSELVTSAQGRTRLQFVALDEVFGSQDDERRGAVLGSLHALAHVFRQVFVVTHLEDVRERLQHVVRVEEGPDRSSRFVPSWHEKP